MEKPFDLFPGFQNGGYNPRIQTPTPFPPSTHEIFPKKTIDKLTLPSSPPSAASTAAPTSPAAAAYPATSPAPTSCPSSIPSIVAGSMSRTYDERCWRRSAVRAAAAGAGPSGPAPPPPPGTVVPRSQRWSSASHAPSAVHATLSPRPLALLILSSRYAASAPSLGGGASDGPPPPGGLLRGPSRPSAGDASRRAAASNGTRAGGQRAMYDAARRARPRARCTSARTASATAASVVVEHRDRAWSNRASSARARLAASSSSPPPSFGDAGRPLPPRDRCPPASAADLSAHRSRVYRQTSRSSRPLEMWTRSHPRRSQTWSGRRASATSSASARAAAPRTPRGPPPSPPPEEDQSTRSVCTVLRPARLTNRTSSAAGPGWRQTRWCGVATADDGAAGARPPGPVGPPRRLP